MNSFIYSVLLCVCTRERAKERAHLRLRLCLRVQERVHERVVSITRVFASALLSALC